jgi:hypothetical protein
VSAQRVEDLLSELVEALEERMRAIASEAVLAAPREEPSPWLTVREGPPRRCRRKLGEEIVSPTFRLSCSFVSR